MVAQVEEFLAEMLPRQLAAEHALCGGDAGPRWETWSHHDPVTLFGAVVPVRRGWDEVSGTFRWLAERLSELRDYEFELVAAGASGDLGYTVGFEHKTVVVDGEPATYTLRVTHVYRREDGRWKIVHRHGDYVDRLPSRQQSLIPGNDLRDVAPMTDSSSAQDPNPFENTPAEWDERYKSTQQVWSGRPNGALVAEGSGLSPGRALDIGCGEGADAVWLAHRGWQVTALDVSRVALDRAVLHAEQAGVTVQWVHAGLPEAVLPVAAFDLVSAQYPALRRTAGQDAEHALLAAVAPGGTLLVVHHADVDAEQARAHGFDPADYVSPADVAALLGDDWQVEVDEKRPREVTTGAGAHHTHDLVLRARRLR